MEALLKLVKKGIFPIGKMMIEIVEPFKVHHIEGVHPSPHGDDEYEVDCPGAKSDDGTVLHKPHKSAYTSNNPNIDKHTQCYSCNRLRMLAGKKKAVVDPKVTKQRNARAERFKKVQAELEQEAKKPH
jgi:hypothetical protein